MTKYNDLIERSAWLRRTVFDMVMTTKRGHVPSSFSAAEILVSLFYGGVARYSRGDARAADRDRVFMSKGHAAHALYPIFADLGYFPEAELASFTKPGGLLRMYADPSIPGIEAISGSLGHGLGIATGICLAARNDGRDIRSFVILGDGECYEGSVWESALFTAHQGLDNVVVIVDRNKLCILGQTEDLVRLDPLEDKWAGFGWEVVRVDGHSYTSLFQGFDRIGKTNGKPLCIIADTVKGKGVSFMEGRSEWHNRMPSPEQIEQARRELAINCITN